MNRSRIQYVSCKFILKLNIFAGNVKTEFNFCLNEYKTNFPWISILPNIEIYLVCGCDAWQNGIVNIFTEEESNILQFVYRWMNVLFESHN